MIDLKEVCLKRLQKVNESIESLKADPTSRLANGMQSPIPNPLTDEQKEIIKQKLPAARELMKKEFDMDNFSMMHKLGLMDGHKFYNDDAVLWRIESITPERLAGKDPTSEDIIYDALYDCADSDYWYMYEKDWGAPESYYDDGDNDDNNEYGEDE